MEEILKCYALDKKAMITIINSKNLVEQISKIHTTTRTTLAALGKVATMAAMMGHTMSKYEQENVTIQISGNGPIGRILCVTKIEDKIAKVKISAKDLGIDLPLDENGKEDVSWVVGNVGYLNVIRQNTLTNKNYNGLVPLVNGNISEDFCSYYEKSEQKLTLIDIDIKIEENHVVQAGGYMINFMPGSTQKDIIQVQDSIKNIGGIIELFEEEKSLEEISKKITSDENIEILEKDLKASYFCDCSRERFKNNLKTLTKSELDEIFDTDETINVKCEFCNKEYDLTKDEIYNN